MTGFRTRIGVTCDECHQIVTVVSTDTTLTIYGSGPSSTLAWRCPACNAPGSLRLDPAAFTAVLATDAKTLVRTIPDEFLEEHTGLPISLDDLIDLHQDLEEQ